MSKKNKKKGRSFEDALTRLFSQNPLPVNDSLKDNPLFADLFTEEAEKKENEGKEK